MSDTPYVEISEWDPEWVMIFKTLQTYLTELLRGLIIRIEHIGSSSIPGLPSKPIIDLDIIIPSREVLLVIIIKLEAVGYIYQGELGIPDREAFKRKDEMVPYHNPPRIWMQHHLYVCPSTSRELSRHLLFRDYLRSHPTVCAKYSALKKKLAQQFRNDRPAYTEAKSEFIEYIIDLAKGENN
jgi:GrpB-like predicted nucleotidyltransferase (UPF0157 family)